MRVLITGGLGFIGSRLAVMHRRNGDDVVVLDNLHPQVHESDEIVQSLVSLGVKVVIGDVRNKGDWRTVLDSVDWIYHAAAETGTGQSMTEVERYCSVNVGGTANLCDLLDAYPSARRIMVFSSRAVYGEGLYECAVHGIQSAKPRSADHLRQGLFKIQCEQCGQPMKPVPTSEDAMLCPASVYAATKVMQEWLLSMACERLERDCRVVRLQNVYGPGQSYKNSYTGVLARFADNVAKGAALPVFEDGEIARDFIYIDDVVHILFALMWKEKCFPVVNVGTGVATRLCDIAALFCELSGGRSTWHVSGDYRFGDVRSICANISRLKSVLGPEMPPLTTIRQGIEQLVRHRLGRITGEPQLDEWL